MTILQSLMICFFKFIGELCVGLSLIFMFRLNQDWASGGKIKDWQGIVCLSDDLVCTKLLQAQLRHDALKITSQ